MSTLGGAQKQRKMIQLHLNSNLLFHRRRRTLRHVSPSHVIRHRLTTSGNGLSSRITCRFIWQVRDHVSRLRQPAEFIKFLTIALLEVIAFHRKTRMLYRFARPAGLVLHSLEPTHKISSLWRCFISNWFRSSEAIYNVLPGPWYSNRLHAGRTVRSRLPTLLRTLMFGDRGKSITCSVCHRVYLENYSVTCRWCNKTHVCLHRCEGSHGRCCYLTRSMWLYRNRCRDNVVCLQPFRLLLNRRRFEALSKKSCAIVLCVREVR